jgi:tyrosine phenol-lyase
MAGGIFVDVIVDEAHDPQHRGAFKGNVDIAKLDALVKSKGAEAIAYISLGATVNMAAASPCRWATSRRCAPGATRTR